MRMSQVTLKFNVLHYFFLNVVHEMYSVLLPISTVAKAVQAGANIGVDFFWLKDSNFYSHLLKNKVNIF
jgi:hypothetical protein